MTHKPAVGDFVANIREFAMFKTLSDEYDDIVWVPEGTIGIVRFVYEDDWCEVEFPQRPETYSIGFISLRLVS